MWQQVLVYLIVAGAAVYLGRYLFGSLRSIVQNKKGCGDGCGKCAFAAKSEVPSRPNTSRQMPNIIPLTDIRSQPQRKS